MTEPAVRAHAILRGRVQGVGFRFFAERWASRLGIAGHARNLGDGTLEIVAEGPRAAVEDFLEAMRRGPEGAMVTGMEVHWETPRGEDGFQLRL
jgi:acylphosphatase